MPKAPVEQHPENIIQTAMEDVMHNSMIPYAEHVIMERAVPRVEDGLKPVQRRILYTMRELALDPDKPHRKCARIVGDCLGKYHPHGDSSVYDALVRLAQPFSMRGTLVDGHGNFGSVDGDSAAAMRYTEARMTPLALQMLRDIDKNTVPFRLNFDDTLQEPDMLPARFPNLLVNGASGIAVGLATNIPPHNLRETIAAVDAVIDNPGLSLDDIMKILPAPDFPTGGVLLNTPELRAAYETGRGKLTLRARVHIEDGNAGRKLLVITEVPYQVNKAAMLEKILHLSEERKAALGCIYDIRDESDRTGMRAVVELRKDANAEKTLAYLFKYSDLQITFGVNMVAIADAKPRLLPLKSVIEYFIRHQKNVVTARTQYELDQARARAHILEGLIVAVDNLDEIIQTIRQSENGKQAKARLIERFPLDEPQAQAILDLRLQRLTGLEILTLRKEYADLLKLIERLEGILKDERKLMKVIKDELGEIGKAYGDDRRTTLEDAGNVIETPAKEEIEAQEATVTFTRAGYLRRMYPRFARRLPAVSAENGNLDDLPLYRFETDSSATLYLFTNRGNCYTLGVGALPEMNKPKDRGSLLTGVLAGLETGEAPVRLLCLRDGELAQLGDLLFVTAQGMVKRTAATEYDVRTKRFAALNLRPGDSLRAVLPLDPALDVLLLSERGMSIRFHADSVSPMGRVAAGVKGMSLEIGDSVVFAALPQPTDQVLLVSDRGFAKRILYMDFEPQARAGKGVKCIYFAKSGSNGGRVAGALLLSQQQEFLLTQAASAPSVHSSEEAPPQGKQDKGMPLVIAVLDDVVTGLTPFPVEPAPEADAAEADAADGDTANDRADLIDDATDEPSANDPDE